MGTIFRMNKTIEEAMVRAWVATDAAEVDRCFDEAMRLTGLATTHAHCSRKRRSTIWWLASAWPPVQLGRSNSQPHNVTCGAFAMWLRFTLQS